MNKSLSVSHAAGRRACLLSTHVAQKDRRLVSRLGASLGPRWVTLLGPPAFRLSTPGSASESRRSQPASPPPAGGSWAPSPASPRGFGWHLHAACDETEMQTVGAMSSKPHGRQAAAPGWHRARHLAERSRDSPAVTVRPFPRQDGPARSLKAGVAFQCPSSLGTAAAGRRRGQQAQDTVVSRASPDHRRGRAVYVPLSPQNAASRDESPRTLLPPARCLSPPRGSGPPKRHMKILNRGVSR